MAMPILVGGCAMSYNGLASFYPSVIWMSTSNPKLDEWSVGNNMLFYLPNIDSTDYSIRDSVNTILGKARIPAAERAIMDYIQNLDKFELGFLYDGIEEYGYRHHGDWSKVEEVAKRYGLLDELYYHIREAYATSSNGE